MGNMQVIKASAGSGKTYTLAKRYLEELLFTTTGGALQLRHNSEYYHHILAITFTNKATNEMKTRIVEELFVLAQDPTRSSYYNNEWKTSNIAAADIQQAASSALATLLFNYSEFKVNTIDSFFQTILRNFARELDHDYNYDLLIDNNLATSIAAQKFLLTLGHDVQRTGHRNTTVAQWVKDFINDRIKNDKGWRSIFDGNKESLGYFARKINEEFFREHMPALREYLSSDTSGKDMERIRAFTRLLKDKTKEYNDRYNDHAMWSQEFQELCAQTQLDEKNFFKNRLLYNIYHNGTGTVKSIRAIVDLGLGTSLFKGKYIPTLEQQDAIEAFMLKLLKHIDYPALLTDIAKRLSFVGLIGEINKKLVEFREESNTLLIADTNELIGRVIKSCDAPFIYERTGTWVNHFMLDEFQDTSRKQYDNFKPLLYESLSNGYPNLVIGDSKQAIYRFRNADPSLFRDQIDVDFERYITKRPLAVNWRSHRSVIEFNNEFIGHMLGHFEKCEVLGKTYMPTGDPRIDYQQEISPAKEVKHPGLVRVHFGIIDDGEEVAFDNVEDVTALLPQHLKELHSRFEWNDINIIVNKKKDGQAVVETLLEWNKQHPDDMIPIVSGELMRLEQSNAVQRLMSLLKFIDLTSYEVNEDDEEEDTQDNKPRYVALNDIKARANRRRMKMQRQFRVLEEFGKQMAIHGHTDAITTGEILNQCLESVHAQGQLSREEQMKIYADDLMGYLPDMHFQSMSLVNIVEHLINKTISQPEREQEGIFLHALLNCVMDFVSKNNGGTVREFLRYWENNKERITIPDSGNNVAIQVLTIHSSKGLEADCVVIPCANWDLDDSLDKEYWIDGKQWLDDGGRRLLDEIAPGGWNEDIVPPILSVNKKLQRGMSAYDYFQAISHEQDENVIIDNVNKTYVAFTRPRKELHIYSVAKNNTSATTINDVLTQAIKNSDDNMGFTQVTTMQYDLGKPYVEEKKTTKPTADLTFVDQPLPPYSVCQTNVLVTLPNDDETARELGKRLHVVLSRINYASQLDNALSYCERRGIIGIDDDDLWTKERLKEFLEMRLFAPPCDQWFAQENKVYNERNLLVVDGHGEKEFKRPDRIVRRPDGSYVVVDYKFGTRNDKTDRKYTAQVKTYVNVLASTTNCPVTGYVWYVITNEIIKVD